MATLVRCWIYTDDKKENKVLISELNQEERKRIAIDLSVRAMEQIGYERTA